MHFIVVTGEFSTDYFEEFSIGLDNDRTAASDAAA
jgi:hypothetical protein